MQLLNLGHGVLGVLGVITHSHFSQSPPVVPTTSQGQTDLKKVPHIRGKSETIFLFHLFELFDGQAWLDVVTSYESLDLSNDVTGILQDQLQLNLTRKASSWTYHSPKLSNCQLSSKNNQISPHLRLLGDFDVIQVVPSYPGSSKTSGHQSAQHLWPSALDGRTRPRHLPSWTADLRRSPRSVGAWDPRPPHLHRVSTVTLPGSLGATMHLMKKICDFLRQQQKSVSFRT